MRISPLAGSILIVSLMAFSAQIGLSQTPQPSARILDEARTVYLGNLARRANGLPPLRWNHQLTDAARWFSWDSVENRQAPYCGHQDTQGKWPDYRDSTFGYKGFAGAENAFCGYVTPEYAIEGWMNSPGHRANLLDPNSREIGLGYYLRESDGRGYVTQDFGIDEVYPPVIIENEAVTTTTPLVNLYVYDRSGGGGFQGMGPATQMKIGNDGCLTGATWQQYNAQKLWTLRSGKGWRSVYVTTRDALNRTVTVNDSIYLGANVPVNQLGYTQMSTSRNDVTIFGLNGGGLPNVQFSLGWAADDTFGTFGLQGGTGRRITETSALGGTAYRLTYTSASESSAWVWTTEFIKDVPMVAYVRLKTSNNTSANEVARFSIAGGGTNYGPLSLKGTDFSAANQYQEFPLAFTFHNTDDPFLIFQFWRSGSAEITFDAVTIFTAPQPVTAPVTWMVPGGNYRGQGVWLRYTNGGDRFSAFTEADTSPHFLSAAPSSLMTIAARNGSPPPLQTLLIHQGCKPFSWQAHSTAGWLAPHINGNTIQLSINQAGLDIGTYQAEIVVEATGVTPISIPVTLVVADHIYTAYLPMIHS